MCWTGPRSLLIWNVLTGHRSPCYARPFMPNTLDNTTLHMALVGYEAERQKITAAIADIKAQLGKRGPASAGQSGRPKRTMSAAAKKRIAAAQKKRWAEFRKKQKAA